MFDSVAVFVTTSRVNSLTTTSGSAASTGATFTSRTTTLKLFVTDRTGFTVSYGLASVTTMAITFVLGLCAWVGVQVITPVFASIRVPEGELSNA